MLLCAILIFALLLGIARFQGGSLLFPPALFAGVWLLALTGLLLWGNGFHDPFYPVPDKAYVIYIVGGIAFTLGGVCTLRLTSSQSELPPGAAAASWTGFRATRWGLDLILVACLIGLPFYWREMAGFLTDFDFATALRSVRDDRVEQLDQPTSFNIMLNLGGVAQFLAFAMVFEANGDPGRRWRAILAFVVAYVYGAMTASKGLALALVAIVALIASVKSRRLKLSTILSAAGIALALFSVGLLMINFARDTFSDSLDALDNIARGVRVYWLSGLVSFGPLALNPNIIPSTAPIHRFFLETARSLGAHVAVPNFASEMTNVSNDEVTNIYTVYYTFFKDHGWVGTIVFMFILGVILTTLYKRAMRGNPIATIFFGQVAFTSIVLSTAAEGFFNGLNTHIKLVIFLLVLYRTLPALDGWRKAVHA